MATMSKRHQARNERALQELIRTVPGNDVCADCQARNPGWASWSLGIFLCMRCASLHRKLGTHISKVKSLSMDSWTTEQVDKMTKIGNVASNRTFNPRNVKPTTPLDVDEVDTAMEKYIRQKYDSKTLSGHPPRAVSRQPITHLTGGSDDDPPPPPPKNEKVEKPSRRFKFGLRSASSALPVSRRSEDSPSLSPEPYRRPSGMPSPIRINKQSRVFGASIGVTEEGLEWKLVTLKEMGFPDDKRNSNVLKGLNGDLERAIASLVRLGEGTTTGSKPRAPALSSFPEVNRSTPNLTTTRTETTTTKSGSSIGAQLQKPLPNEQMQQSRDRVVTSPPLLSQQQSYNPFDTANPMSAPLQQPPLEQAFQNMQITQPLFPNATGGYPNNQQLQQQARQQHSMPPLPQMPQQNISTNPFAQQSIASYNPYVNMNQAMSPAITGTPYFTPQQTPIPSNPYFSQTTTNPFFQQNQNQFQPQLQQPQQTWTQQQPQPYQSSSQPFFTTQAQPQQLQPQFTPSHPYFQDPYQHQPLTPQRTGRIDKSSIMALYNYPHLAPPPLPQPTDPAATTSPIQPSPSNPQLTPPGPATRATTTAATASHPQRSVTMPAALSAGSNNPFLSAAAQGQAGSRRKVSVESAESGRHSPDAFASLSARFVR